MADCMQRTPAEFVTDFESVADEVKFARARRNSLVWSGFPLVNVAHARRVFAAHSYYTLTAMPIEDALLAVHAHMRHN